MKKEELKLYVETGREIEFLYKGKWHSITYYEKDADGNDISFCEFYKEPINVSNFDDLCNITYKGVKVIDMWESMDEDSDDYCVY